MDRQKQGHRRRYGVGLLGLSLMASLWVMPASAQMLDASSVLYQWLQQPQLLFGERYLKTSELRNFYAAEGFRPLWVTSRGLTPNGGAVLNVLANAGQHGLNIERYHVGEIRAIAAMQPADDDVAMQQTMGMEVLMSSAILRYAADMEGGTVAPQWETGKSPADAQERVTILKQVAEASDPASALEALAPNNRAYNALKNALQNYQAIAAQGGWAHLSEGSKITPGQHDARIATVRQILIAQGDLAQASFPADTYDIATADGIKHFQERHGIEPDGVIGKSTQDALNIPAATCVQQIAMTMERMRWMPHDLGSRYVLVNIPAYQLTAVSGNTQLAMDVIVGKPDTKTPMFSKEITSVVLNPTWSVPAKIAMKEMLPKIRNNPDYLANAGFSVIDNSGHVVLPSSIDWETASNSSFDYTLRQDAGDGNALGKVKFLIPDSDDIYLHDTSNHGLFARADRSLSHGCVRLSNPRAMTQFVLNSEGWSEQKIASAYDSDASRTVKIAPLPVHLVYWTAWVDDAGRTHFGRDVYGMDKPLMLAMYGNPKASESIKLAMN